MPVRQQILAVTVSLIILVAIIYLVRKRKLREEFSWLWIITGVGILVLSLWYQLLVDISALVGAVLPVSTLFFFGIIFLMSISLHFSVKISDLTNKVKDLAQRIAIMDLYISEMRKKEEK